ncbi:MaoC family dehydratase N-terminal domain-containing protein [Nocardiopsis sp. HNM0947]|uniref:MaoC family dehydratase N-terminal domain-containing protein n=1 Tax=Nocardiopsis coralli TaxID=2772213 RepID=A0ABR9PCH0_9ACTN|nr:MaoC family dehydratase N-terminal domain-containing protein [Nocardiopsis coralli]MBE3001538.1 MaoC family dehydratase N-terminal domain-containing protein [Nocardiopsis coralli]
MSTPEPGTVERTEVLAHAPAAALAGLLGVEEPDAERGSLPLLWHWLYTLERPAQADLGADGHPVRGTVPAPPGPGRRRMWAGGRVTTHAPLRFGVPVTRRTRVLEQVDKEGRSGALTFVTVGHELEQDGRVAVREEQDIVYRDAAGGGSGMAAGGSAPAERVPRQDRTVVPPGPDEWEIAVDPVLLFRFSALTYNGHRIHYDREYATTVEGYPGLVTHGPLQAVAMAERARALGHDATSGAELRYRLVSPLFDDEGLVVGAVPAGGDSGGGGTSGHGGGTGHGGGLELSARDRFGRRTAQARLT